MSASPDAANALSGQPIEGVHCPTTRTWSADALRTLLVPFNGATTIVPSSHNLCTGSFMAKFALPHGGSLLNQDSGTIHWTLGGGAGGTPINMSFLFDGGWAHTAVSSVNHSLNASAFNGKYYEWDYSRIYLKP